MALAFTTFGPFFKVTCTADVPAATEADLVGVLEVRRRRSRAAPTCSPLTR